MPGRFIVVKCECGHQQVVFSHASIPVKCLKCGKTIAVPTGGKAQILGKVIAW